jgi:diguanylate cyclase (GGDEF)-like protein/PAS domain S-box-containing protein
VRAPATLATIGNERHRNFSPREVRVAERDGKQPGGLTALHVLYEHNPDGVLFTRPDQGGLIVSANPAARAILCLSEEQIIERGRDGLWDPDDARWSLGIEVLERTGEVSGTVRVRRGDGRVIDCEIVVRRFDGPDGERWGCLIFRDITDQRDAAAQVARLTARLEEMAVADELTGLSNRLGMVSAGIELLAQLDRRGADMQVVYVDVHRLSDLNDRLGHEAGDAALQAVALALRLAFRKSDVVARIGGTLFAVLAPDLDEQDRPGVEKRIIEHLTSPETVQYIGEQIDFSLGWTTRRPGDPTSLEELIGRSARAARTTALP